MSLFFGDWEMLVARFIYASDLFMGITGSWIPLLNCVDSSLWYKIYYYMFMKKEYLIY